jgi:hypothetical protein
MAVNQRRIIPCMNRADLEVKIQNPYSPQKLGSKANKEETR